MDIFLDRPSTRKTPRIHRYPSPNPTRPLSCPHRIQTPRYFIAAFHARILPAASGAHYGTFADAARSGRFNAHPARARRLTMTRPNPARDMPPVRSAPARAPAFQAQDPLGRIDTLPGICDARHDLTISLYRSVFFIRPGLQYLGNCDALLVAALRYLQ